MHRLLHVTQALRAQGFGGRARNPEAIFGKAMRGADLRSENDDPEAVKQAAKDKLAAKVATY